jgi:hypothetical protein
MVSLHLIPDPTYSSFPHSVKDFTTTPLHFSLNDLGPFLLPSNPIAASYIDRLQGNTPTDVLLPDDQLSCIDHVYYANSESRSSPPSSFARTPLLDGKLNFLAFIIFGFQTSSSQPSGRPIALPERGTRSGSTWFGRGTC